MTGIGVALIGAGQMGANHARTIFQSDHFRLGCIYDINTDRANALARQFGSRAISSLDALSDVQAAIVATSTDTHYNLVGELLKLKIPVLCEKPLTPSLSTTRELIGLSEQYATVIQCGFVERFNPAFLTARNMINSPIVHAHSVRHSPRGGQSHSGVAEDLLIHDIDLALSLAPVPVKSMIGAMYKSSESGFAEISDCILELTNNSIFMFSASRMSQRKIREWRICTEGDLFEIDLLRQTVTIYKNINQEAGAGGGASYRAKTMVEYPFIERAGEPLAMQLQHFKRLIDGEIDIEDERQSILASHELLFRFLDQTNHSTSPVKG
jgi:predicted dehydrogenase